MMSALAFGKAQADEMLLPAKPGYVVVTFIAAFLLNMLPLTGWALVVRPDFVALVLLYWGIRHPRVVGFTPAFVLGLVMDVADGSLFGQHALAYCMLMALGISLHRRIALFGVRGQVLHIVAILLITQLIILAVRVAAGNVLPGWWYFLPSASGALVWPLVSHVVTMPLRPRAKSEEL